MRSESGKDTKENKNTLNIENFEKGKKSIKNARSQYINQINELKNKLELLNGQITNLTEEKEYNTIKLTELIHENEQLKKNINITSDNNALTQNKKYELLIMKLKKNIAQLNEEKKSLEEIIIKQEEKVNELNHKVNNTQKEIIKKDFEIKESMEYNTKLINTLNLHQKEIQKLKQSTKNLNSPNTTNNNNNIDVINIINLRKEIQEIKKEIETKDNKINLLSMNNKILQGKVNKLSQTCKNGFNVNPNMNNINLKSSLINNNNIDKGISQDKKKFFIIAKPKPTMSNERQNSTSMQLKNDILKNKEDYNINIELINRNNNNQKNVMKKRNNSNINNIKRQKVYDTNIYNVNYNPQINKILDLKYKEIESKYKKEIKKEMKDDTLFNEDIIDDIKEEIVGQNQIVPLEIESNKEARNLKSKLTKQHIATGQSFNTSQDNEYQIIETYCVLSGQKKDNDSNNNSKNFGEKITNQENLHNCFKKKILDEI
jgi:hypothetical protein